MRRTTAQIKRTLSLSLLPQLSPLPVPSPTSLNLKLLATRRSTKCWPLPILAQGSWAHFCGMVSLSLSSTFFQIALSVAWATSFCGLFRPETLHLSIQGLPVRTVQPTCFCFASPLQGQEHVQEYLLFLKQRCKAPTSVPWSVLFAGSSSPSLSNHQHPRGLSNPAPWQPAEWRVLVCVCVCMSVGMLKFVCAIQRLLSSYLQSLPTLCLETSVSQWSLNWPAQLGWTVHSREPRLGTSWTLELQI